MSQIADLVIDLGIDAAEFKNEIPRIRNLLNGAASEAERSSARMQRFMERQTQAARQTTQAAFSAAKAAAAQARGVDNAAQVHERMAREVEQTRQRVAALNQKMRETQAQAAALAAAQDKAAAAFYRQTDSVKQTGAGLQELQRIQQQVNQARKSGGISQQDYLALLSDITAKTRLLTQAEAVASARKATFIRQLKEQVARQNLSSTELLRARAAQLGVSSAAEVYIRKMERAGKVTQSLGLKSAAARRELGVMLGELARGNFGALRGSGITMANRAGWLETLMTPKGMAIGGVLGGIATAVYGLGKAWYEGQKEGTEFNRQLILTGNYAGKSAGQLQAMARALSGNGITQHAVAGVLAQVVGSGAFSGDDAGRVANAAVRLKQATGQEISETISQFKRLKDDPVNAVVALNDSLHFLTATQYQQIAAAQAQGDSQRAVTLAMQAYSDAVIQRTRDVRDNLGTLETAWNWVKNAASGAWDAMLGIGRTPDTAMKRQEAFAQWQTAEKEYQALSRNLNVGPDYNGSNWLKKADADRLKNAREQLALKKAAYDEADKAYAQEGLTAAREKQHAEQQTQAIRNQQEFNQLVARGATQTEKRVRAQEALNRLIARNRQDARDGVATLWTEKDIAAARAGIEKAYKEPKTPAVRNDEATRLLLQYSQQQAQVEGQIAAARQSAGMATEKMTEARKQLLALQQRIIDLGGKKLTADEKSVLAHKDELIQALTLLDVKQQELQKQTALNDLKKKAVQLASQLAEEERAQRQQHDLDIATTGMGDKQRQRYQTQFSLQQKYQQQLEQLERDSKQKGTYGTDEYREAEQTLTDSLNRRLNENRRYWQEQEQMQADWKNGAMRAFQNFTADADNAAGTAEQLFNAAFSSAGNGLATFCTTGKLNFKSFTASLLSDLAKIMAQLAMMKAVKGIGSALGIDFGDLSLNADGGVYQSADLSRYSGTVVNRPTFFAFAKGAGVMGEAGPEAILPLRRGADGKLGVVADIGGSGMVMFAPQYNIEINNDGTNGQIGPAALKAVYDLGKKAAADFMQQQARDGGRLSGAYR